MIDLALLRMEQKGLCLTLGVMDFMRNPAIQLVADNLDIGKKAYKIHTDTIDKNGVQDYVSLLCVSFILEQTCFIFRTFCYWPMNSWKLKTRIGWSKIATDTVGTYSGELMIEIWFNWFPKRSRYKNGTPSATIAVWKVNSVHSVKYFAEDAKVSAPKV